MPSAATSSAQSDQALLAYLNLKLREIGQPEVALGTQSPQAFEGLLDPFLELSRERDRQLATRLCPVDQRIQNFLYDYLETHAEAPRLPSRTLVLDQPQLARLLSLPPQGDEYLSEILSSYRTFQGVLHNPKSDRRTTKGIFHVTEGGLPIPDDKKAVPPAVFARLLARALQPPESLLRLPFAARQPRPAATFVSLLLRPVVCPAVPGFSPERSLEVRFLVPGSLVANLDFVERIFGNAGDPHLPANDAALDPEHWTGHTGCVILAPHLNGLTKAELGLPAWEQATARQRRDGMCWKSPEEPYNDGSPFKLTARDASGVVVTLISDNYFGYCKKEVKTQISFAANLLGRCEEEHAGGAIAFPSYDLGEDFQLSTFMPVVNHTFAEALARLGDRAEIRPGGWARDRVYPDVHYVPGDARFDLRAQRVTWRGADGATQSIKLLPRITYVLPSGYKVEMVKPDEGRRWRLRGTTAEGLLCHKPCTVSGGGKSEISKSIADAIITGPVFVSDLAGDLARVQEIFGRNCGQRFRDPARNRPQGRAILSPQRSLGSVVKLLSHSPDYTDEYNAWLDTIPRYIRDLILIIKRLHRHDWEADWPKYFSVDTINGRSGNELKFKGQKLLTQYLRVGFTRDGSWRTFGLRKDFLPAVKIQVEDDITASTVAPVRDVAGLPAALPADSVKFVHNCERYLFQRPDDAIHRGYDRRTELDFSRPGNFFSNYEPLHPDEVRSIVDDTLGFESFTAPMQDTITRFLDPATGGPSFLASSAHPRLVDGKPSKNPRYLQFRPDLEDPRSGVLAQLGARLYRELPSGISALFPVGAVLMGRRQNPPEPGVRPLCVYNPVHYQELPEAFMDLIASLTGKSPSTTGAGSEGALTKGPFNALPPIYDLNAALVSFIVTDLPIFASAAGWVGPKYRVDHDISLLVPEIWCRMTAEERRPAFLIDHGFLERCTDFEHEGRPVLASRLGWRITERFVQTFCGRVFGNPSTLFEEEMLRPELQDRAVFADAMDNIVEAMRSAADHYFADGSIEQAVPPLQALLHLMRHGTWQDNQIDSPAFRALFNRDSVLASDWYRARLEALQKVDVRHQSRAVATLRHFAGLRPYADVATALDTATRLADAEAALARIQQPAYVDALAGTLGAEPWLASCLPSLRA